jgi:hypothetical protein
MVSSYVTILPDIHLSFYVLLVSLWKSHLHFTAHTSIGLGRGMTSTCSK